MGGLIDAVSGIVGGVTGAITGFGGKKSSYHNVSGINLADASDRELEAFDLQDDQLKALQALFSKGATSKDYATAVQSQRDLAKLLGEMQSTSGLPTEQDIDTANRIASQLFGARQTALQQLFEDQTTEANRLAARLGRPVNDPILQAKLRTGFIRQQDLVNAEQNAAAQNLALQLPGQRLGFAQAQSQILSALGDQAVSNINYLLSLGNQIANQERNFRLQTGERYSSGSIKEGGGIGGAITGAIGGIGAGLEIAPSLSKVFSSFNPFSNRQPTSTSSSNYEIELSPANPFQFTAPTSTRTFSLGDFQFRP